MNALVFPAPSATLLQNVRAAFVHQGTSLSRWCAEHGITRQYATATLLGKRDGRGARALRFLIIEAARQA